jgi:hypothetical protein
MNLPYTIFTAKTITLNYRCFIRDFKIIWLSSIRNHIETDSALCSWTILSLVLLQHLKLYILLSI